MGESAAAAQVVLPDETSDPPTHPRRGEVFNINRRAEGQGSPGGCGRARTVCWPPWFRWPGSQGFKVP